RTIQDDLNVHTQSWDGPKKRASFHVGIISTRSDAYRGSSTPRGLAWICRADHSSAGHPRFADHATTVWSFSRHCCCHYPLCVWRRDPSGTTCTQTRRPIWHIVLTLSIVIIEVILISAVMLGPRDHQTIARDSVMAVAMIIMNLVV